MLPLFSAAINRSINGGETLQDGPHPAQLHCLCQLAHSITGRPKRQARQPQSMAEKGDQDQLIQRLPSGAGPESVKQEILGSVRH